MAVSDHSALRWDASSGFVELGEEALDIAWAPGGVSVEVSGNGEVTAWVAHSGDLYLWTSESAAQPLGSLGSASSSVVALSHDGAIVVGNFRDAPPALRIQPYIWDRSNGLQPLLDVFAGADIKFGDWNIDGVTDISGDGRVFALSAAIPGISIGLLLVELDCPNDDDCDTVLDADDNCPGLRTTNIDDANGNGIGDMCECGDQTGDGHTDMADIMGMVDVIFEREEASPLCDTNDDDACNVADILGVNAKIFGADAYCARYPTP